MDFDILRGEGAYLIDTKNEKYLDMFSGIAVNNFGHANKQILKIIEKQALKGIHFSNYIAHEPAVNLARLLVENTFASKVFYCNSGTEANEAAIKLSRKYGKAIDENKIEIVSAVNSFHGRTCGAVTLTGQEKYSNAFMPLLPAVKHFIFNDIESLKSTVSDNTCALFLEIIQGEGGVIEVDREFVQEVVKLSEQHKFLIVIDEIQTGISRTGDFFAYEKFGLTPDLVTIAKSLGGGLPIGAMLVSQKLENVLLPGDHGTTFGGNALACAVGEYIVGTVLSKEFRTELKEKEIYLSESLNKLKMKFPKIINLVRGRGLMFGIDVGDYAEEIKSRALEQKLLLNVTSSTVIRLLPALTITIDELNEFIIIFERVLGALCGKK
jgi:acetylornithine/N-succinyldiaminopimelate aminotransferase